MTSAFRTFSAILLALLLVMTGQAMAVARGAPDPAGQMVLCTGTGPTMVYVDQNGQPTGPPVFCPKCALASLAVVAVPVAYVSFVLRSFPVLLPTYRVALRHRWVLDRANARAPPFSV